MGINKSNGTSLDIYIYIDYIYIIIIKMFVYSGDIFMWNRYSEATI